MALLHKYIQELYLVEIADDSEKRPAVRRAKPMARPKDTETQEIMLKDNSTKLIDRREKCNCKLCQIHAKFDVKSRERW